MRSSLLNIFTFVLTSFAAHALPSLKLPLPLEMRHLREAFRSRMFTTIELSDSARPLRVLIEKSRQGTLSVVFDLMDSKEGRRFLNQQTPESPSLDEAIVMAMRAAFEALDADPYITQLNIEMNPRAMKEVFRALSLPKEFSPIRAPRTVAVNGARYPLSFGVGGAVVGGATGAGLQWWSQSGDLWQSAGGFASLGFIGGAALGYALKSIANAHEFKTFGGYLTRVEVDSTIRERVRRWVNRGESANPLWILNPCEAQMLRGPL